MQLKMNAVNDNGEELRNKEHGKYSKLFELMRHWQEYESMSGSNDLEQFSVWLNKKVSDSKRSLTANKTYNFSVTPTFEAPTQPEYGSLSDKRKNVSNENIANSASMVNSEKYPNAEYHAQHAEEHIRLRGVTEQHREALEYYKYIPLTSQITAMLTRLARFLNFYTKKIFVDSAISSTSDFGVLAAVEGMGTPRKIEAIHLNLLEKTTGTEIIKRLVKAGLLEEFDDDEDKRSKRLRITEQGKQVCHETVEKLQQVAPIVTGNLSNEKKRDLAEMLEYLNHFHNAIYFNQHEASIDDIVERNVLQPMA